MIKMLIERVKNHIAFRKTYAELSRMNDRELYDIGLQRSMITRACLESIYGKEQPSV